MEEKKKTTPADPDADLLRVKGKKGTWKRFLMIFPKCRLPWVWVILYTAIMLIGVNVGVDTTETTADLFGGDTSAATVGKLIFFIVLNLLVGDFTVYFRMITSARIDRNMRGVVFEKLLRIPMSFFGEVNPRDAVSRILKNCVAITSTLSFVLLPMITAVYKIFTIAGRVTQYDWRLSLVMLGFIPLQFLLAFLFGRINFNIASREADLKASLTNRLVETITNIPLIKAFAKEEKEAEKSDELISRKYNITIKSSWLDQVRDLSGSVVSLVRASIMVIIGMVLLGSGSITNRNWIAFFLFSSTFTGAFEELTMYWNNLKIIQGGVDRVAEILDAEEEETDGEECLNLEGDLHFDHVQFAYQDQKNVLKDVTCTFPANQVTALLGVSGSGKSTMTNLLLRLYQQSSGEIRIGEKNIQGYSLQSYRQQFAMVSQSEMLFSGTIRENLLYGVGQQTDQALLQILDRVGLHDFMAKQENGLDTLLEEYGGNLSGGQRQRLALARALLSSAQFLILDEPTASMDAIGTEEMLKIFRAEVERRTLILIAHSRAVLPYTDHCIVLGSGVVQAEGSPEELIRSNDFLKALAGKEDQA